MTSVQKKFRAVICAVLSLLLMLTMISFPADASAMTISRTSFSLTKGYAIILSVTGAGGNVKWSSSDSSVASVDSNGKVSGKKIGNAVITAKSGSETATCQITVVGGKILTSTKSVNLKVGEYKYVTVRAKGSHGLKVSSNDKNIVTGGWVKPWDGDDIKLRLTGKSSGSTTVKINLTKYPDIYTTISVTVGKGSSTSLALSQNAVTTKVGDSSSVILYCDNKDNIGYSFSESGVAQVTEGKWSSNYCTLSIKGLKNGTTKLTVYRKDNTSIKETITITVSDGSYYTVLTSFPTKASASDLVYRWTKNGSIRYMLVPAKYDMAKINGVVAKDLGKYEYYTVYESTPSKILNSDSAMKFTATVYGQSVTRYILVPAKYDTPSCNTAIAEYTGEFKYWTVYNTALDKHKTYTTDVIKSWTTTVDNKTVTRYILLPYGYSESQLQAIIDDDKGSASGYYTVFTTKPNTILASDKILTFQAYVNGISTTCYILVPTGYDEAQVNDAKAAFNGKYDYYTVYNTQPAKLATYDIVQTWTKTVNSKQVTRYMLLPYGYSQSLFENLKAQDLQTSSSAYYSISTSYPMLIASGDSVYTWYNESQKQQKYMLLPLGYDLIKRNDLILSDTGKIQYYTLYSSEPKKYNLTDIILPLQYSTGFGYMLVPTAYDQDKVDQALKGINVN